jgi:hypothetical protein
MDAPRDPEVRFMETASGAPIAVRAWWAPGETTGYEFIYSKEQLAALNRGATAARSEEPAGIDAEPAGEPVAEGPVAGPDVVDGDGLPPEEPDLVAQAPVNEQAPPPAPAQEVREETRQELPQTASPIALFLLAGLASTGIGLRLLRKS